MGFQNCIETMNYGEVAIVKWESRDYYENFVECLEMSDGTWYEIRYTYYGSLRAFLVPEDA